MAQLAGIVGLLGTAVSAAGTIAAGNAAAKSAEFEAKQLDRKADEERAAAQREAMQQRKETDFVQSRAQAVAAASGLGALDETVLDLAGDLEQEGAYRERMIQYSGSERAAGYRDAAKGRRVSGQAARQGAMFSAAGTLLSGASSFYDKYASSMPQSSTSLRYG